MPTHTAQHTSNTDADIPAARPEIPPRQTFFTVEQFAKAEPAFTPGALRNLIFKAEARQSSKGEIAGNGLIECGAVVRRGRKVLINRQRFLAWLDQSSTKAA